MTQTLNVAKSKIERAFLVGVQTMTCTDGWSFSSSMAELSLLARSAGAKVVGSQTQKLAQPSPTYYIGRGKLNELLNLKQQYRYNVVIFNDELSPRQQQNLEEALCVKVIDRTALILDIFARRAHTREGHLQVELAQHQYVLPRLAGQWSHLERLGGGIGTRGPGESQLETDRRLIRNRIKRLKAQIEAIRKHRALYRQKRKRSRMPVVALVGYTNAGKSTLLNALSQANVSTEDKLFSTLDPVTKRLALPSGQIILLTDTVGFIHKLPPSIVAAFRATLEELAEADLLVHVVDIIHRDAAGQFRTVEQILSDLNLADKPRITALNKVDLLLDKQDQLEAITETLELPNEAMVPISAFRCWGLEALLDKIGTYLAKVNPLVFYCERL